ASPVQSTNNSHHTTSYRMDGIPRAKKYSSRMLEKAVMESNYREPAGIRPCGQVDRRLAVRLSCADFLEEKSKTPDRFIFRAGCRIALASMGFAPGLSPAQMEILPG